MGANAQTSVPTFTAGDVLTAANMNISARTGVPVFADTTARDAGFGGTGEKTLAEGQLCYLESTNVVQYYDGAAWATVGPASAGALTYITSATLSGTTTVSNVFSSTYSNYLIVGDNIALTTNGYVTFQLGATTTAYYWGSVRVTWAAVVDGDGGSNDSNWKIASGYTTGTTGLTMNINAPQLAQNTTFSSSAVRANTAQLAMFNGGWINNTTAYTAFTLGGTGLSGTIRVYGYANS